MAVDDGNLGRLTNADKTISELCVEGLPGWPSNGEKQAADLHVTSRDRTSRIHNDGVLGQARKERVESSPEFQEWSYRPLEGTNGGLRSRCIGSGEGSMA